jgi:hypothetical protein
MSSARSPRFASNPASPISARCMPRCGSAARRGPASPTVSNVLAARHGRTAYHYDYHDARGHLERRAAGRARTGSSRIDSNSYSTTCARSRARGLYSSKASAYAPSLTHPTA